MAARAADETAADLILQVMLDLASSVPTLTGTALASTWAQSWSSSSNDRGGPLGWCLCAEAAGDSCQACQTFGARARSLPRLCCVTARPTGRQIRRQNKSKLESLTSNSQA